MISSFFTAQILKFQYVFENGGLIMIVIFGLGFAIWFLLLSLFLQTTCLINNLAHYCRKPLHGVVKTNQNNEKNKALTKTLISICPLVGLLGSTTGMVEVFRVIELYGTDSPQVGFSLPRVVIPTLVSLIVSISGLIGLKVIDQRNSMVD